MLRQTAELVNFDHSQADEDLQLLPSEGEKREKRRDGLIPSGPTHTRSIVGTVDKSVQQRACISAL